MILIPSISSTPWLTLYPPNSTGWRSCGRARTVCFWNFHLDLPADHQSSQDFASRSQGSILPVASVGAVSLVLLIPSDSGGSGRGQRWLLWVRQVHDFGRFLRHLRPLPPSPGWVPLRRRKSPRRNGCGLVPGLTPKLPAPYRPVLRSCFGPNYCTPPCGTMRSWRTGSFPDSPGSSRAGHSRAADSKAPQSFDPRKLDVNLQ